MAVLYSGITTEKTKATIDLNQLER
jgi:hypothetical protein